MAFSHHAEIPTLQQVCASAGQCFLMFALTHLSVQYLISILVLSSPFFWPPMWCCSYLAVAPQRQPRFDVGDIGFRAMPAGGGGLLGGMMLGNMLVMGDGGECEVQQNQLICCLLWCYPGTSCSSWSPAHACGVIVIAKLECNNNKRQTILGSESAVVCIANSVCTEINWGVLDIFTHIPQACGDWGDGGGDFGGDDFGGGN